MRVLAVAAHPDDLEQLCGGTLARLVEGGHEVTMCHVSRGDRGSFDHSMEEIAAIRRREAIAAAEVIGAAHECLELSDGEVNSADPRQKALAVDLIRRTRPDLVITHHTSDYMSDHVETGRLIEDASFVATLPLYRTQNPVHAVVPALYYMDTLAGLRFSPTEYVDITDTIDTKLAALAEHASQLVWLRDHDGIDILEQTRTVSAFRGFQAGTRYAEGFIPALTWLRARTVRLLP